MSERDPSSSGTSLLSPPTNNEIWFQDAIPLQEETKAHTGAWEVPSAPWWHKLTMALAVVFPFLGCIAGIAWMWQHGFMGWFYLSMLVGGWFLTGMGVTIGFHRLLSHRSFDTYNWVRIFWMSCASLSMEGSPLTWCATHRRHHELSDQPGDPHTPHLHGHETIWAMLKGFWYAHTGWLFTGYWNDASRDRYIPDLLEDKSLVMVDKMYYLWVIATLALPAVIGGVVMQTWEGAALGFLWGGLVRVFLTHHVTWSINSICHIFGSREYKAYDESRNNWIFGLLAFGEGWHNNHHAFPTSARHGLRWWQFDSSWIVIRTMQMLGLVWNVKLPSDKQMAKRKIA